MARHESMIAGIRLLIARTASDDALCTAKECPNTSEAYSSLHDVSRYLASSIGGWKQALAVAAGAAMPVGRAVNCRTCIV